MQMKKVQFKGTVELPAVLKGGIIEILPPDFTKLDSASLKNIAEVMGGTLVFPKVDAIYIAPMTTENGDVGSQICTYKGCWMLNDSEHELGRCEKHADQ